MTLNLIFLVLILDIKLISNYYDFFKYSNLNNNKVKVFGFYSLFVIFY